MKSFLALLLLITFTSFSQTINQKIQTYLENNLEKYHLTSQDVLGWEIQNEQNSNSTKIKNYRIVQRYQGIDIFDSQSNVWVKDNQIIQIGNRFHNNISQKANTKTPSISLLQAAEKAYSILEIKNPSFSISEVVNTNSFKINDGIQEETIFSKLGFQTTADNKLRLAWNFQFYAPNSSHYWDIKIDAVNAQILDKKDLTISCNFGNVKAINTTEKKIYNFESDVFNFKKSIASTAPLGSYKVIPYNYISPNHHAFQLITTSGDPNASPNGWHNANSLTGVNPNFVYTYSRGNNVHAQEDADGNDGSGLKAQGGSNLNFDFPYGGVTATPTTYTSASITNLFYMNNIMHDVWYQYGFDEANANFQANNLGRGGVISGSGDAVSADAQDGYLNATPTLNNANFSTPHDGFRPRMQMYMWNSGASSSAYLYADSDFDNQIIAHEYGHGISNRLIGGGVAGCMTNSEQMGEGWSDWFGLMMQLKAGDVGAARRSIGTYDINQSNNSNGIRSHAYSTNLSINPLTLDYSNVDEPHDRGEVWAATLWDLTWAYIAKYGYDSDIYYGIGGNNKVMRLVLDALKLQTCNNSSFISGRDNLIAADQATTGGADYCLITEVFARRGMGLLADSGDANNALDQFEDFTPFPAGPNCLLSVNYFENNNMIRVFPNPSNGLYNIRINNYIGKINFQIVDLNGRVVWTSNNIDFNVENSIDITSLQSGMYILKVNGNDLNYSQKIFKN